MQESILAVDRRLLASDQAGAVAEVARFVAGYGPSIADPTRDGTPAERSRGQPNPTSPPDWGGATMVPFPTGHSPPRRWISHDHEAPMTAPSIIVERDVAVLMRDGVTLRAAVYRPAEGGPRTRS
jgi:predicted acyl esterase